MNLDKVVNESMKQTPVQIVVQYIPQTGQFAMQSPPIDNVMKLGMLEMAKALIAAEVAKAAASPVATPTVKLS